MLELSKLVKQPAPRRLLALDPGDTTGWSVFGYGVMLASGQIVGDNVVERAVEIRSKVMAWEATHIVAEEFRIYSNMAHKFIHSDIPTLRLIGAIELIAADAGLPLKFQGAAIAKKFCTDDKLKSWGLWEVGMPHARDSIRHGVFALVKGWHYGSG